MSKRLFLVWAAAFFCGAARGQISGNTTCGLSSLHGSYAFIHDGIVFESNAHMAEGGSLGGDLWGLSPIFSNLFSRLAASSGAVNPSVEFSGPSQGDLQGDLGGAVNPQIETQRHLQSSRECVRSCNYANQQRDLVGFFVLASPDCASRVPPCAFVAR
jgi:hypothetical protein